MTILIVEESLLIGRRIHNLLAETGHIDTIYQSVEHKKAATLFQNIQPQVVVLDMCLPGSLTIELLQTIKTATAETAVVALVNCEDYRKQLKCITIGADYILDKYHEFEKIPHIIETIISKRNLKTSNEKPGRYSALA